jgi:hypothetical protein
MILAGDITIAPCHDHDAVGGMSGITSASSPMAVIENKHHGNFGYSQLFQGPAEGLQDRNAYNASALKQWHWLDTVLGPTLQAAVKLAGGIDVRPLTARALEMGDECHNRNTACTALLLAQLAEPLFSSSQKPEYLRQSLKYLVWAEQFSLVISMAAAKATADAMKHIPYCTLVTSMSRNGVNFGIKVSGLGEKWFTAPANKVNGLYFSSGWSDADALLDIGDSAIMETVGLGGHVQAAAPALQQFVGGSFTQAVSMTREMTEITESCSQEYRIPNMDFFGAPTAIDIRKVIQTGITPVIDTAIAHNKGGVIGAGQSRAPYDCFSQALHDFYRCYRSEKFAIEPILASITNRKISLRSE